MKVHKCLICNAGFSQKSYLKVHEENVHKSKKFNCQDCGQLFAQKSSLSNHINTIHKGLKYECKEGDMQKTGAIKLQGCKFQGYSSNIFR